MTYWQKRNLDEIDKLYNSSRVQIERQLQIYYKTALKQTLKDFEAVFNKYEALKALGLDVTPNMLYTLERYWETQVELRERLNALGNREITLLTRQFEKNYEKTFKAIQIPNKSEIMGAEVRNAEDVVRTIWCADGKHFSQRVWDNTSRLVEDLNEGLANTIITGRNFKELKWMLIDSFNVSYHRADTVIRTELANIQNQAANERYKSYGIQEVEVLITDDDRTCEICKAHEGERHSVEENFNCVFHPNDRCTIIPVLN